MALPANQKIFHITPIDNLQKIVDGKLWSDAQRIARGLDCTVVGMNRIKTRRLEEIEVDCHPDTHVGDYVPFYFCPRSVMLYILHKGNDPDLRYRGGQRPIVHLQADLAAVLEWVEESEVEWAFSRGNAGAYYTTFSDDTEELAQLNWARIAANDWRDPDVKEAKQSEFLVYESFPWTCIELIGVYDSEMRDAVAKLIAAAEHQPEIAVRRDWYY